jgi:DNA-binding PadR family transcriptional regulator
MTDAYKVPFYILGYLIRLGPLHGYQLKARIEHEASDFAHVKLPNLYYHLKKMEGKGWVSSRPDREGNRPEKEVYSVAEGGRRAFEELRDRCLDEAPVWDFAADGALFFAPKERTPAFKESFERAKARAEEGLRALAAHKARTLAEVPEFFSGTARLIFEHHELHRRAELEWLGMAVRHFTQDHEQKGERE